MLSKEEILSADDRAREEVDVPEWGGTVFVSSMSGADRDEFEQAIVDEDSRLENIRARLAALTITDDSGSRLFSDSDIKELGKKSAKALDRVFNVAKTLNAIGADEVEGIEKN